MLFIISTCGVMVQHPGRTPFLPYWRCTARTCLDTHTHTHTHTLVPPLSLKVLRDRTIYDKLPLQMKLNHSWHFTKALNHDRSLFLYTGLASVGVAWDCRLVVEEGGRGSLMVEKPMIEKRKWKTHNFLY